MTYEFHPVADIFPLMQADAFGSLCADIGANGLREPIWLHPDNRIIDGRNRYRACVETDTAPTFRTYDGTDEDLLPFVLSLNLERRHLTSSQRAVLALAVEAYEAKAAKERQGSRSDITELIPEGAGEAREKAAERTGTNPRYVSDAKRIQADAPELIEHVSAGTLTIPDAKNISTLAPSERQAIIAKIDAGDKPREAIRIARAEANAELAKVRPAIPEGTFSTLVIDPPWPMKKIARDVRPNQVEFDYPTMNEAELVEFGQLVDGFAAPDCHLFLWTTHKFLPMSLRLLDAWGFRYVLTMVWHKAGGFQPIGLPQYNCEFALYARRGAPSFVDTKAFPTCFNAPRREHSRKPSEFYETIRRVTDAPRLDVFSRGDHEGFDAYGNEADNTKPAAI